MEYNAKKDEYTCPDGRKLKSHIEAFFFTSLNFFLIYKIGTASNAFFAFETAPFFVYAL